MLESNDVKCSIDRLTVLADPIKNKMVHWVHNAIRNILEMELSDHDYIVVENYDRSDSGAFGIAYCEFDDDREVIYSENLIYAEVLQARGEVFLRYDFNPNSLKKRNAEFVWFKLKELLDEVESEYRLSRFDLAMDILNTPEMNALKCVRAGVTRKEFYGRDGVLETIYWGSRQSEAQIRLYNKIREMKPEERELLDSSIESWWRLEMQMRSKKINEDLAIEFENRLSDFILSSPLEWDLKDELKRFALILENTKDVRQYYPDKSERTIKYWKAKVRQAQKSFDDYAYREVLKNALQNQMQDIKCELDKYLELYLGF